jgi:hypothetical protein
MGVAISMESPLEQEKKVSVLSLAYIIQNPPMTPFIPDHSNDETQRDEDACNPKFESFPTGRSM